MPYTSKQILIGSLMANADQRTFRKYLRGEPVRPDVRARIERVLEVMATWPKREVLPPVQITMPMR